MNLTDEQQKVVAISAGRHLVLAPPGSGKTELRIRTAQALFDLGDVRWVDAVKGTAADFERLGKIDAPAHEETLRVLIAAADSCGASHYAKKLRNVIFVRAQRMRGPLDFERMA